MPARGNLAKWMIASALLACGAGSATEVGGEEPAAPRPAADDARAQGLEVLRLLWEGGRKEIGLLKKLDRQAEANALPFVLEPRHAEGLRDIERLLAPPVVAPVPSGANDLLAENDADPQPPQLLVYTFRGGKRIPGNGGNKRDDLAQYALRWLSAHQSPDGRWEAAGFDRWCHQAAHAGTRADGLGLPAYDVGVTGLALAAFAAAGYSHRGEHEHAHVVARGLAFLVNGQDEGGRFSAPDTPDHLYNHAAATWAMVEMYGLTTSPILGACAQRALDWLAQARNAWFGARYGTRTDEQARVTTSWAALAIASARFIRAAEIAVGLPTPLRIDEGLVVAARAAMERADAGPATPGTEAPLTPLAALGRVVLRMSDADVLAARERLGTAPGGWTPPAALDDVDRWSLVALAACQLGGEPWRAWNLALYRVSPTQRLDGALCDVKGSLDPRGPFAREGGRVHATAVLALLWNTPQRYARVAEVR